MRQADTCKKNTISNKQSDDQDIRPGLTAGQFQTGHSTE